MTTSPDELRAALALASLPGVGPVTARRQREAAGSFVAALAQASAGTPEAVVHDAERRADELSTRCRERGIAAIPFGADGYPESLAALEDPPVVLFAEGDVALASRAAVALVGSRHATPYGLRVARELSRRLAERGVVVVSGLAAGIDAEAHAATLDARGGTIAVLGTGIDVAYPVSNDRLQRRVARGGLLVSELPPGRRAHAGAFPRRNRIIAALADVVLVVQAGARSGALITAQVGNAVGRVVAAVPGPIDEPQCEGTNRLLRDGAQVIASVDDVLGLVALTARGRTALSSPERGRDGATGDATGPSPNDPAAPPAMVTPPAPHGPPPSFEGLSAEERVLAVLGSGARTPDELVRACQVSPRDVGVALATLTVRGAVAIDAAGFAFRLDRVAWAAR